VGGLPYVARLRYGLPKPKHPVQDPKLISILRQPELIAASRCYLIQMLRSALTCTNGCSCWSLDERNSAHVFPYHGCALPTELGGQVIASAVRHRHCSRDADEETGKSSTQQHTTPTMIPDRCCINPANALLISSPLRRPHPRSRLLPPATSRPDLAATQALRLGNPVAPGRGCAHWTGTTHPSSQAASTPAHAAPRASTGRRSAAVTST
jgi:hypothetical protein